MAETLPATTWEAAFSSQGDAGSSWPGLEADLLLCSCVWLGEKRVISYFDL